MNRKYEVNSEVLLKEDDISYYLLGYYMTDGCVEHDKHANHFSLTSKDVDHLQQIRDLLCPNKPFYKNKNTFKLSLNDKDNVEWLMSYGCIPRKSLTLKIERDIPKEYVKDFIRGCMDGDGCISIYKKKCAQRNILNVYLCSASEVFIDQIINLIQDKFSLRKEVIKNNKNPQYRIVFSDRKNRQNFLNWIYYPNHKISMPRKNKLVKIIEQDIHHAFG